MIAWRTIASEEPGNVVKLKRRSGHLEVATMNRMIPISAVVLSLAGCQTNADIKRT